MRESVPAWLPPKGKQSLDGGSATIRHRTSSCEGAQSTVSDFCHPKNTILSQLSFLIYGIKKCRAGPDCRKTQGDRLKRVVAMERVRPTFTDQKCMGEILCRDMSLKSEAPHELKMTLGWDLGKMSYRVDPALPNGPGTSVFSAMPQTARVALGPSSSLITLSANVCNLPASLDPSALLLHETMGNHSHPLRLSLNPNQVAGARLMVKPVLTP
jgi:hypothetical protein